jgi:acetyl esterase
MFNPLKLLVLNLVALSAITAHSQTPETLNDRVDVIRGLEFTTTPSGPIALDLYLPHAAEEPVPAIIVIPGGGFRPQVKEKFAAEAQRLAEAGFAAASIGYRGSPKNTFIDTTHDCKAAVRFVRANAARFNINPDRLGAFGQSAGGHLAGLLAVSGDVAALEGDGGHKDVSSRVQAAVTFAGVFDFISRLRDDGQQLNKRALKRKTNGAWIGEPFSVESALWKLASPVNHITIDDPPLLIVHCKDDGTVPFQQSVQMRETMTPLQPATKLLLFEEGGHGIRGSQIVGDEAWAATIAHFNEHLARNITLEGLDDDERPIVPPIPPTQANVHYGPHARNLMDVWTVDTPKPAPVLISIHGGAFRHGQKKISSRYLRECLDSGMAVVTLTYRFVDEAIAPAQFQDVARAIQFIRHNAAAWNLDPTRIASSGGSAGAGLSLWLGFHDDLADPDSTDPVARQSTRLTCMAVENGQTSYDPRFIRDLFPGTDTWTNSALANLFGVDLKKLDELPAAKYALFDEVSALPQLSADDVPALLVYKSKKDAPITSRSIGIHHPRFGYALKKEMDALGIECQVHPGLAGKDAERARVIMDFVKRHLGVSGSSVN